jgi:L-aminopeptidase/D-esterase-like protein
MWKGQLKIESEEAMSEFFDSTSDALITQEEKDRISEVVEEADTVSWPMEIVFEIQDTTWEEFSNNHPDEAKVIENHLEHKPTA